MTPRAVVLGCAGPVLSDQERRFFARTSPFGFILFARNVESPDQVRALVGDLRQSVERADAPVMIDQEGGRVQRLRPPHWRAAPPAARFGALAALDLPAAAEAAQLNARLIGGEATALDIDMVCAPVLDLGLGGAHGVIGDRAFSADPAIVAALGRAACEGFLAAGISPILKHIPGHGRGLVDSHLSLPVVDAGGAELAATDFRPFKALSDMPWAMTAHVLYRAIDTDRPATTSPHVISSVVRGEIGFHGVLISDDLSMQALSGPVEARAAAALDAGCDLALHCNGRYEEMVAVAGAVPPIRAATLDRLAGARRPAAMPADAAAMVRRLNDLLARVSDV